MPSYVIIWENNTFGHMKVKGQCWSGHAAMNIGSEFAKTDEMAEGLGFNYVSWWPGHGAKTDFDLGGFIKDVVAPERGRKELTLLKDVMEEKYLPDHVIRLPSTDQQEARMMAEWRAVHLKRGGSSFKSFRKNCSTIVSRVLHAGGYYARKWALDCNFAWTPADIRKLAVAAGGTLERWDDMLLIMEDSGITAADFTDWNGKRIYYARSGRFCTTGVPCKYQPKDGNGIVEEDDGDMFQVL